ncbi:MAG: sigma-70 family RNA polymerase sigma factor, partial [Myxococcota bacterium]
MDPDQELLDAWRGGDEEAGTQLFQRLFRPCRRFFFNKVPERDVEDLLQLTFTALVEGKDRFRGDSSFRTYVLGVARIILLRYLRTYARRGSKISPDLHVSSIAAIGVTPGTVISTRQDQEHVRVALQNIPVHYQTILELFYWEGLTHEELAATLELDRTTVRTRLFRGRKALAKALEGKLDADEA